MNETIVAAIGMFLLAMAGMLGDDAARLPIATAGTVAAFPAD